MRSSSRQLRGGFTLLEVMGAVVVLGLVYVVLAEAAIQGLRGEGDADRRLRAGLLADAEIAQIESSLALGTAPVPGRSVRTDGDYEIEVSVTPFAPPGELLANLPELDPAAPSLLHGTRPGDPGALRAVEVHVRWDDGSGPLEVVRVTWAYDPAAAEQALQLAGLGADAAQPGAPGSGGRPGPGGSSSRGLAPSGGQPR
jgi:hypothetical protein